MQPIKPLIKVEDLPQEERKFFTTLVRELLAKNEIYSRCSKLGYNPEMTEETIIHLIDEGLVRICYDKEKDVFWIETWNGEEYI